MAMAVVGGGRNHLRERNFLKNMMISVWFLIVSVVQSEVVCACAKSFHFYVCRVIHFSKLMFAMKSKFVYIVVGAEHEDIWNS